jgi:NAD(P)-dependent dehydrogenase (short-subunit alcohol dehydrogenase family)
MAARPTAPAEAAAPADLALEAGGRIDAVIHNAGIARNTTFDGMDDEHWFPVIETHLLGGFSLARAVWPTMAGAGYGRFVITSSATGMWGRAEGANYGAAKAGLTHRYYSAIRGRCAEIFVAVNDGWVATGRRTTDGRRAGRPPRHRRGPVRLQRAPRQPRRGSHRVTADCPRGRD